MQRLVPILFAALFGLLFLAVALAGGIDSSSATVPPGDVAVIEGAPPGLDTISKAQLEEQMRLQGAFNGQKDVPQPGDPDYGEVASEAVSFLIGAAWLQIQAGELGVEVTARELEKRRQPQEERNFREAGLTQKDIDEILTWELVGDQIQEKLAEEAPKPSGAEIRSYYRENHPEGKTFAAARDEITAQLESQNHSEIFFAEELAFKHEWGPRTHCAAAFIVEQCEEFPAFEHPPGAPAACYEADPKAPAEECPAPVVERNPVRPGSVRTWKPEGERLAQGPVPAGGGEAEASGG